jgi:hypothetical protein
MIYAIETGTNHHQTPTKNNGNEDFKVHHWWNTMCGMEFLTKTRVREDTRWARIRRRAWRDDVN